VFKNPFNNKQFFYVDEIKGRDPTLGLIRGFFLGSSYRSVGLDMISSYLEIPFHTLTHEQAEVVAYHENNLHTQTQPKCTTPKDSLYTPRKPPTLCHI